MRSSTNCPSDLEVPDDIRQGLVKFVYGEEPPSDISYQVYAGVMHHEVSLSEQVSMFVQTVLLGRRAYSVVTGPNIGTISSNTQLYVYIVLLSPDGKTITGLQPSIQFPPSGHCTYNPLFRCLRGQLNSRDIFFAGRGRFNQVQPCTPVCPHRSQGIAWLNRPLEVSWGSEDGYRSLRFNDNKSVGKITHIQKGK